MRRTKKINWAFIERLLTLACTIVAVAWICGAIGYLLLLYSDLTGSEMSSWAQTVGTVAAVFAAIWTVRRQEKRENVRTKNAELITAKALVDMSRNAQFAVMRLHKVIRPGARFPYEVSEVQDALRNFDKIDLLTLPDARLIYQDTIIRANLRFVIKNADLAENLIDRDAAMKKVGLIQASHMILHGAWLNLAIVFAQLGGDEGRPAYG